MSNLALHPDLGVSPGLEKLYAEHKEGFEKGAIFAECETCGTLRVLSGDSIMARAVREQMKIAPPSPCGVEVKECPECMS